MKTLYIDCGMGAAGDMLSAALLELLPDPDAFIKKLNSLGIPGVRIQKETAVKCGITGTHFSVLANGEEEISEDVQEHTHTHEHVHFHAHTHGGEHVHSSISEQHLILPQENGEAPEHEHPHDHEHEHEHGHEHHHHSSMAEIDAILSGLGLPEKVLRDVQAVYGLIAEAESQVHGVPVADIHFHEVGTMDAVADITAVCLLMNEIAPDEVVVSPIHVGTGHVRCAHGILPVPAPATLRILQDVPIYGGEIRGELCTPTGAALLKHFADRFGDMPVMRPQAVGYGMGKKDFKWANCVRVTLGETEDLRDKILELSCGVDDMTGEEIAFACEKLFAAGANDVSVTPIYMKKSRPAHKISVICHESEGEAVVRCMFRHTTTIGIRRAVLDRYILDRRIETVQTPYGEIRRKVSTGYGVTRIKYEYEDLARIASEQGMAIGELRLRIQDSMNE